MQQISASVICLCPNLSFMFMKQTMQVKEVGAILTLLYPLNYTRQEQAQKQKTFHFLYNAAVTLKHGQGLQKKNW